MELEIVEDKKNKRSRLENVLPTIGSIARQLSSTMALACFTMST